MNQEFDFVTTAIPYGLSVIEASAGTGKTFALSHLVPRLLLENPELKLSQILLVTYTNDAAHELSERVRRILAILASSPLPNEKESNPGIHQLRQAFQHRGVCQVAKQALLDIDLLTVSTIHSFCQKTLQTEGALCGLPVVPELITDASHIEKVAKRKIWEQEIASNLFYATITSQNNWEPKDIFLPQNNIQQSSAIQFIPDRKDFHEEMNKLEKECLSSTSATHETSKEGKASQDTPINFLKWYFQLHCSQSLQQEKDRILTSNRQITYDGLIRALHSAITRGDTSSKALIASLQKRYKVALIDESQDTDPQQFDIFKTVFVDTTHPDTTLTHRLILIGDPKQAIYAFRGADVNTYLAARKLAGNHVFTLTKTYRAPKPLVQAINAIFMREGSLLKQDLSYHQITSGKVDDSQLCIGSKPDPARVEFWIEDDILAENYSNDSKRLTLIGNTIAQEIAYLLNSKATIESNHPEAHKSNQVKPSDFAILVSEHAQAVAMQEALTRYHIPAIIANAGDIMSSEEAKDILAILSALEEPRHKGRRFAAITTRLLGITSSKLATLDNEQGSDPWLDKLQYWKSIWQRSGIATVLATIDQSEEITSRLASMENGERRITNFRQLTDILESATLEIGNKSLQLIRWLTEEIDQASSRTNNEERQLQLESDAEAVQITTMHAVKGLEFSLVFCPFLWSMKGAKDIQILSSQDKNNKIVTSLVNMALAGDGHPKVTEIRRAQLEDRLRLAYVAITRAKVKCWIYGGAISGMRQHPQSALDWLLRTEVSSDGKDWDNKIDPKQRGKLHKKGAEALVKNAHAEKIIKVITPPRRDDISWTLTSSTNTSSIEAIAAPYIPPPWQMTSFSALTREKNPYAVASENLLVPQSPTKPAHSNSFTNARGGTLVGTAIHEWIEQWNFSQTDLATLATHFNCYSLSGFKDTKNVDNGIDPDKPFEEQVMGMLEELRLSKLPGMDCQIQKACSQASASEWSFQIPINNQLSPKILAQVFSQHGEKIYADALAALSTEQLQGYLHGFLDRIAYYKGTWGVIDWKTNNLRTSNKPYSFDSMLDCAIQHHYLLQVHLYLVALRRYLGSKAKIAGGWLVFLREVKAHTDQGILYIPPNESLLAALDQLFTPAQK